MDTHEPVLIVSRRQDSVIFGDRAPIWGRPSIQTCLCCLFGGLLLTILLGMLGYVHFLITVADTTPRPSTFQGVHGVDGTGRLFYKSNEHTLFGYFKAAAPGAAAWKGPTLIPPTWTDRGSFVNLVDGAYQDTIATGFPFRCFVGEVVYSPAGPTMEVRRGSVVSGAKAPWRWLVPGGLQFHAAPTSVRLGGMLLNWISWSAVLLALTLGVQAWRRNRRQARRGLGLCPACGYEMGLGRDVCPECGGRTA